MRPESLSGQDYAANAPKAKTATATTKAISAPSKIHGRRDGAMRRDSRLTAAAADPTPPPPPTRKQPNNLGRGTQRELHRNEEEEEGGWSGECTSRRKRVNKKTGGQLIVAS